VRGLVNEPPYDGLNEFGVPSDPYVTEQGIYFSNGPVWIERVGEALGDFGATRPVEGLWPHAANYAWGGARAYASSGDGNRHLDRQVTDYLEDVRYEISPETLHALFIGGNDMVEALVMLGNGAPFPDVLGRVALAVAAVDQNLQRLIDAGARRFLVLNVPDVGLVPAVQHPVGKGMLSCFAELANWGVTSACPGLPKLQLPDSLAAVGERAAAQGVELITVDTFGFIRGVAATQAFGVSNATESCVTPLLEPFDCEDPNSYLFWDGLHPTTAVHRLLGALVVNRLGQ